MSKKRKAPMVRDRVVRLQEALGITGHRRSTFLNKVKAGEAPQPVRLGPRAIGWYESELQAYIRKLPRAAAQKEPA